ncbi:MAG TPA: DUF6220 domain-containing protein [Candidatus Acidoferrum sp.]|nr:DUF6220 domain-containing protein [Candidatus Acidoferrum sp.]
MPRYFRWIYFGWLALTVATIVVQFYLAGYGVFAFNGLPPFDAHRAVGDLIGIFSLIGIALAFAARVPWRITGINALFFVLMVIQSGLAFAGVHAIAALHVVNGVLIFGVVAYLTRAAYGHAKQEAAASAPART